MATRGAESASAIAADASSADESPSLSIVAPAYNESAALPDLVGELTETLDTDELDQHHPYEIVIVDDGSTDGTGEAIEHLASLFDAVRGVSLRRNFGQAAAIAAGIDHAAGEFIVTIDADGQNDPGDIPALLDRLEDGYDCVSGWRRDRKDPLSKRLPSRIQTTLAKATGPDIHDFGCTLTAYRARALHDIQLYGDGHRYIPSKLYNRGYEITELPVRHRRRDHGTSKYGPGRLVRGTLDLLFHLFYNRYGSRPLHLFGSVGVLMTAAGAVIGAHMTVMRYGYGVEIGPNLPRLILVAVLLLGGLLLFALGFLSELLVKLLHRDDPEYRVERVIG